LKFLVSDQDKQKEKDKKKPKPKDYPDLSDSDDGTSKGGEEEYSSTESEESDDRMPPQKTTKRLEKPTPSIRQTTLTQLFNTPVVSTLRLFLRLRHRITGPRTSEKVTSCHHTLLRHIKQMQLTAT